ncbi:MAG: hypothetical protein WC223_03840 [Bacteroidales bacterium]
MLTFIKFIKQTQVSQLSMNIPLLFGNFPKSSVIPNYWSSHANYWYDNPNCWNRNNYYYESSINY